MPVPSVCVVLDKLEHERVNTSISFKRAPSGYDSLCAKWQKERHTRKAQNVLIGCANSVGKRTPPGRAARAEMAALYDDLVAVRGRTPVALARVRAHELVAEVDVRAVVLAARRVGSTGPTASVAPLAKRRARRNPHFGGVLVARGGHLLLLDSRRGGRDYSLELLQQQAAGPTPIVVVVVAPVGRKRCGLGLLLSKRRSRAHVTWLARTTRRFGVGALQRGGAQA